MAVACITSAPARAEDCGNASTQMAMNECAIKAFEAADMELNAVYQQLTAKLDGDDKALLTTAQRAWIAFRDGHCAFVGSASEGGSIQAMVVNQCMTQVTQQRTEQINVQAACEEGDVACVAN